jgi:hypothetical protein
VLWMIKNMICIQMIFPEKLLDVIHLGVSFVQKWTIVMKKLLVKERVVRMMELVLQHAKEFKPLASHPSDVGFI